MRERILSGVFLLLTATLAMTMPMPASAQPTAGGEASLARNFYFIFDGSGSMAEPLNNKCTGDKQFSNRLAGAKWAVKQFMPQVPDDVNLGLWIFDAQGNQERVPLG